MGPGEYPFLMTMVNIRYQCNDVGVQDPAYWPKLKWVSNSGIMDDSG